MLKKFIFKLIKHITNPLESLYFDVRKIYWLYAKIYLTYLKKIKFPETSFLCPIDYIDLLNLWKNIVKRKCYLRNRVWLQHICYYSCNK